MCRFFLLTAVFIAILPTFRPSSGVHAILDLIFVAEDNVKTCDTESYVQSFPCSFPLWWPPSQRAASSPPTPDGALPDDTLKSVKSACQFSCLSVPLSAALSYTCVSSNNDQFSVEAHHIDGAKD